MKHIVSFSGGRTSAYMVHLMEKRRKEEGWDVDYVFFETAGEHPATYRYIKKIVSEWGINLTCLKLKINPELGQGNDYEIVPVDSLGWDMSVWRDLNKKYGNPTAISMHCTRELKSNLMLKYVKQFDEFTIWIGIRVDEKRRLKEKKNFRYLAEISQMDKTDIIGWWRQQPFDLEIQEHLGNCVFCVKKSIPKIALAMKDEPGMFNEWVEMLNSKEVRIKYEDRPVDAVYRGVYTPDGIAKFYAGADRDQLHMSMTHAKKYESGSCSESCEVFSDQMDLFGGAA